jgi:hypothetical protein
MPRYSRVPRTDTATGSGVKRPFTVKGKITGLSIWRARNHWPETEGSCAAKIDAFSGEVVLVDQDGNRVCCSAIRVPSQTDPHRSPKLLPIPERRIFPPNIGVMVILPCPEVPCRLTWDQAGSTSLPVSEKPSPGSLEYCSTGDQRGALRLGTSWRGWRISLYRVSDDFLLISPRLSSRPTTSQCRKQPSCTYIIRRSPIFLKASFC